MDIRAWDIPGKVKVVRFALPSALAGRTSATLALGTHDSGAGNRIELWSASLGGTRSDGSSRNVAAKKLAERQHAGDVIDMSFVTPDILATSSSNGSVYVWKTIPEDDGRTSFDWLARYEPHSFGANLPQASCNGVTSSLLNAPEVASCGEDGRVKVYRLDLGQVVEDVVVDPMSLSGIEWVGPHNLLLASTSGQLHLRDRRDCRKPWLSLLDPGADGLPLYCVSASQAQANKVASGNAAGRVAVWDLRNAESGMLDPVVANGAQNHVGAVWDVGFHPSNPDHVVSCGNDGRICVRNWAYAEKARDPGRFPDQKPYWHLEALQSRLAANSVDVHGPSGLLAAGSDGCKLLLTTL